MGEVAGFSYLEPRRHIGDIAALDGHEATSFGPTIARVTSALKAVTGVELVYVYVFGGGIPHLHVHLAPYVPGGPLNDQMVKGEVESKQLPSGASLVVSKDYPVLPEADHTAAIRSLRKALSR
jgi:diadenosine tetraphosphate (Ap4A) HIT family hydrolase